MNFKFTDEIISRAAMMLSNGATLKSIGATLGVHPDNLSIHLRKRGVTIPKPTYEHGRKLDLPLPIIAQQFALGMSTNALARLHGVSRPAISRALRELGLAERTRSEAMTLRAARSNKIEMTAKARIGRRQALSELRSVHIGPGEDELFCGTNYARQTVVGPFLPDATKGFLAVELKQRKNVSKFSGDKIERIEFLHRFGYSVCYVIFDTIETLLTNRIELLKLLDALSVVSKHARCTWRIRIRTGHAIEFN